MKLLNRNEIIQKKNDDRRREIEDGMKLAKRIDSMRKTVAEEEVKQEKYRTASKAIVTAEITSVLKKLERANTALKKARSEAKEARKPLDTEWAALTARKAEIEAMGASVQTTLTKIVAREASLDAREHALEIEHERVSDMRTQAEDMARRAINTNSQADERIHEVAEHERTTRILLSQRERDVASREDAAAARERDNQNRASNLDLREKELRDEERRVRDLYETLLRTKQRIKK